MSLAEARKKARGLLYQVETEGRDPFAEVCRQYIGHRRTVPGGKARRVAAKRTTSTNESILRNYIEPRIGKRLPQTLTSAARSS